MKTLMEIMIPTIGTGYSVGITYAFGRVAGWF